MLKVNYSSRETVLLVIFVLLTSMSLFNPGVYGNLLANLGRVELLKAPPCPPDWFVCVALPRIYPPIIWEGNSERLQWAAERLRSGVQWNPGNPNIYIDLAAALFALSEREEAADALSQAEALGGHFLILRDGRYEYHLLKARMHTQVGEWDRAVQEYRLGLALGAERTLPVDESGFYITMAAYHREQAMDMPDDGRAVYLTGKYLALAGEWEKAITWLNQGLKTKHKVDLRMEEQARAYVYLGLALENLGEIQGAREAYERAITTDPSLAEGYIRLLALVRRLGDEAVAQTIEKGVSKLTPPYILGQQGEGYEVEKPKVFASGWTLLGYSIDEEALEAGPLLDLLLWWEAPNGMQPEGKEWVNAGTRWFQWQHITNLAPNAGFEWGVLENGMPEGYALEDHESIPGSVYLEYKSDVAGDKTHVMVADSSQSRMVVVESRGMPVDANAWYLLAGWKWATGLGNIGRACIGPDFPGAPLYVAYSEPDQPLSVWLHFANVDTPMEGKLVTDCWIKLPNLQSKATVQWDNILFARIGGGEGP